MRISDCADLFRCVLHSLSARPVGVGSILCRVCLLMLNIEGRRGLCKCGRVNEACHTHETQDIYERGGGGVACVCGCVHLNVKYIHLILGAAVQMSACVCICMCHEAWGGRGVWVCECVCVKRERERECVYMMFVRLCVGTHDSV